MRDRIVGALGDLSHRRFLVYLMGPYRAVDIGAVLDAANTEEPLTSMRIPGNGDFGTLGGSDADPVRQETALDLLLFVRDRLRTDAGVNAFLAIDIDIPLDELDAATQSIEFAFASNAVIYAIPPSGTISGSVWRSAPSWKPSIGSVPRAKMARPWPAITNGYCSSTSQAFEAR